MEEEVEWERRKKRARKSERESGDKLLDVKSEQSFDRLKDKKMKRCNSPSTHAVVREGKK